MKSKKAFTMGLLTFLLSTMITAAFVPKAKALETPPLVYLTTVPTVTLYPDTQLVSAGQQVTFYISVCSPTDELDLFGWQVGIEWDSNTLVSPLVVMGDFAGQAASAFGPGVLSDVWLVSDRAPLIGQTFVSPAYNGGPVYSPFTAGSTFLLFSVTFTGAAGLSGSQSCSISLNDVELLGRYGNPNTPNGVQQYTQYDTWPDVNKDGAINILDAIWVANHFGSSYAGCDFNGDGVVDTIDCAILASDFGLNSGTDLTWGVDTTTIYEFAVSLTTAITGPLLGLSVDAPVCIDAGGTMTYTFYYENWGETAVNSAVLYAYLSSSVQFQSASDGGSCTSGTVTWTFDIPAYPNGQGSTTVVVQIPNSVSAGTVIPISASIPYDSTSASASAQTTATTALAIPQNTGLSPILGTTGNGTPVVYWNTPITFTYTDTTGTATNVYISIQASDGTWITSSPPSPGDVMTQVDSTTTYQSNPYTFYPHHGQATVTYTVYYGSGPVTIGPFNIYCDPSGYVYDTSTLKRVAGATVWLQQPDGSGGWKNVSTGQTPPAMQPDVNPEMTNADGQFQWDVLNGTYRVHVEAPGYLPADSIVVNVPPPVTDLHVGLTPLHDVAVTNVTADRSWVFQGFSANINVTVLNKGGSDENVNITLYYNVTADEVVGTENVSLLAGENETVSFVWDTAGVPCRNYTLTANATIAAGANTMAAGPITVRTPGDINGDGKVDILDAIMLGDFFFTTPSSPNWNPNADLNGDGVVNILDAIILASHFGQTAS